MSLILFICFSIYFITCRPKALGQSHVVAMGHSDFLKHRIKWSRSVSVGTIFLFSCVLIKIKLLLFIACLTNGSDFHCSVLRFFCLFVCFLNLFYFILLWSGHLLHTPLFHGMCLFYPTWLPCFKLRAHGSSLYRPKPCAIQSILGSTVVLIFTCTSFWCWLLFEQLHLSEGLRRSLSRWALALCVTVCACLLKPLKLTKGLQPLKPIVFS